MVITVDEVKAHLKITYDDEDAYLESLIRQAQAAAEDFCRVSFDVDAPEPVRLAVLLMVSHYHENRDNPDKQVSPVPVEHTAGLVAGATGQTEK